MQQDEEERRLMAAVDKLASVEQLVVAVERRVASPTGSRPVSTSATTPTTAKTARSDVIALRRSPTTGKPTTSTSTSARSTTPAPAIVGAFPSGTPSPSRSVWQPGDRGAPPNEAKIFAVRVACAVDTLETNPASRSTQRAHWRYEAQPVVGYPYAVS